jgi:hypothetical protein
MGLGVGFYILCIDVLRPRRNIYQLEVAAVCVEACLTQPVKEAVEEFEFFLVVIEVHSLTFPLKFDDKYI